VQNYRIKCAQFVILSALVSLSTCTAADAMLSSDGLNSSAQKAASELREFSGEQTDLLTPTLPNKWLQIPTWLAGSWCSVSKLEILPPKGLSKSKQFRVDVQLTSISKLGTAKDSKGRIWQYAGTPASQEVEIGGLIEKQTVQQFQIVNIRPDVVELKTIIAIKTYDGKTGTVYSNVIEKGSITYRNIGPGQVWMTIVDADYDTRGRLLRRYKQSCNFVRIAPFVQDDLGDLKLLFQHFVNNAR
jgi:hypothetical protein